jgi:hypothetical protein
VIAWGRCGSPLRGFLPPRQGCLSWCKRCVQVVPACRGTGGLNRCTLMHMDTKTVRITVSLPRELHRSLVQAADASNISASAMVRAILSDLLPRLTSVLELIGSVPVPAKTVEDVDAWTKELRGLLHDAPHPFEAFGTVLDKPSEEGEES